MLTIHHLRRSQSERIVWLCEELAIPYELKRYDRDPQTMAAPAEYKALHALGAAPVMTDGAVVLAESQAIVEYIINVHGSGRLAVEPGKADYPHYLYWLSFVNGTLQPGLSRNSLLKRAGLADDNMILQAMTARVKQAIALVDDRLATTHYLAGDELSAADIMMVFTLTTMRYFAPLDVQPYRGICSYLQRIARRPAYQTAMAKSDPAMPLLLD